MALTGYEKPLADYTKSQLIEIAKTYTVYYQTGSGKGSIGGYDRLTIRDLIKLIESDRDYQRARPKSRVELLKNRIKNLTLQEDIMREILDIFKESTVIPEPGKFYTFIYKAKTPNIEYDQHPLIACTELKNWGFRGLNFHWSLGRQSRNYTWEEVIGKMHIINYEELDEMLSIPYAKFRLNK